MRQLLFITLLFCSLNVYSQEKYLIATPNGFPVVNIDYNKNQSDFVNKTHKWINKTYENPNKVVSGFDVNGKLLTDVITINGFEKNVFYHSEPVFKEKYYYDVKYKIELWLDKNQVKFHITILEMKNNKGYNLYFIGTYGFFDKNGNLKEWSKKYNQVEDLETFVNNLFISYKNTLLEEKMTSDEALELLKKLKSKLDLELITQEEYDNKKKELIKFID
jgi:hypothetical protein